MDLSALPLEIRQQIAGCIETVHQPSLYAFSLTNRDCHAASLALIFRRITITVNHPKELQKDIEKLYEGLFPTDSTHHVQHIRIKGPLRLDDAKTDGNDCKPWWNSYGLDEILDDEEWTSFTDHYVVHDESVIEKASKEDMAWAPVVKLLLAIPHLRDLIFECKNQFPPCLLELLEKTHPQCRLHHLTFRFRTLLWNAPHPYEMELATSPLLHRVKVACAPRDTNGDDDFSLEATMELAAGLAPNLKEVERLSLEPMLANRHRRRRQAWKSLPGFTGRITGFLTHLSIKGVSELESPTMLQDWACST